MLDRNTDVNNTAIGRRKLRLLAVALARAAWDHLTDRACRSVIESAERYADRPSPAALGKLNQKAKALRDQFRDAEVEYEASHGWVTDNGRCHRASLRREMAQIAVYLSQPDLTADGVSVVGGTVTIFRRNAVASIDDQDAQRSADEATERVLVPLIRDIFGNPFRSVAFDPTWRTDTAVSLAQQMYDGREFSAMPILADALQDAGCENADVLGHCRGTGPHVRGCWVVDLVLGKA